MQYLGHGAAEESGYDGGRCFIGAEPVGVGRTGDGGLQQGVMLLHGGQHVDEEGDELQVALGVLAGSEQGNSGIRTEGPVIVLAGAVHAVERLFVEQYHETVLAGDAVHQVHDELVLVIGEVGLAEDGRQLELVGRHLVMTGLDRDAQPVAGDLQIPHEGSDARRDRGEVMVVQLLVLGRIVAEQCASCNHQVRAGSIEPLVHEEILLLPTQVGIDLLDGRIKELADRHGCVADGLKGLLERRLVVQGLSSIGDEDGRYAKGVIQDEDR